jgi:predicted translin family RNA/ssDNA-binding protein
MEEEILSLKNGLQNQEESKDEIEELLRNSENVRRDME